jgi:hypothetical protein
VSARKTTGSSRGSGSRFTGPQLIAVYLVIGGLAFSAWWPRISTTVERAFDRFATSTRPSYVPMDKRVAVNRTLAKLRVTPDGSMTGYSRAAFGPAWSDVDHNGCDTRNDILARDLTQVVRNGRCVVVSGMLVDPYSGKRIVFAKATAGAVQIDHVVALADAWRTGAATWTPAQRLAFANDPANLLAADGAGNDVKSDRSADRWAPNSVTRRCRFARVVVAVKVKYGLTVTQAEHDALAGMLGRC